MTKQKILIGTTGKVALIYDEAFDLKELVRCEKSIVGRVAKVEPVQAPCGCWEWWVFMGFGNVSKVRSKTKNRSEALAAEREIVENEVLKEKVK